MCSIRTRVLPIAAVAVAVASIAGSGAASASAGRVRIGSTTPLPSNAIVAGSAPAAAEIPMTIALQPQDPSGLAAFATAVSTPGSAEFRHYLTVPEFAQRFGATPAAIGAVQSSLRAAGLQVGSVPANDLTIPVKGTAAQVQSAFSLSLAQVKLASGRTAYANEQAPALPASIAGYVQGVIGLSDVVPDQPAGLLQSRIGRAPGSAGPAHGSRAQDAQALTGGPQPCSAATNEIGTFQDETNTRLADEQLGTGLTADELATAYQFSSLYLGGDLGAGQTVALFEQQPYDPTDVATYQACFGTNASVSNQALIGRRRAVAGHAVTRSRRLTSKP
jgi:subtilase family serine protease